MRGTPQTLSPSPSLVQPPPVRTGGPQKHRSALPREGRHCTFKSTAVRKTSCDLYKRENHVICRNAPSSPTPPASPPALPGGARPRAQPEGQRGVGSAGNPEEGAGVSRSGAGGARRTGGAWGRGARAGWVGREARGGRGPPVTLRGSGLPAQPASRGPRRRPGQCSARRAAELCPRSQWRVRFEGGYVSRPRLGRRLGPGVAAADAGAAEHPLPGPGRPETLRAKVCKGETEAFPKNPQ